MRLDTEWVFTGNDALEFINGIMSYDLDAINQRDVFISDVEISNDGGNLIIDCPDIDFKENTSSKSQHDEIFSVENGVYPFEDAFKYVVEVILDDCDQDDFMTESFITQMSLAA